MTETKLNKNFQTVTSRLIELIEQGTTPWQKPWNSTGQDFRNLFGDKPYSGINPLICLIDTLDGPQYQTQPNIR
jgi:antirestriction protein ArdC